MRGLVLGLVVLLLGLRLHGGFQKKLEGCAAAQEGEEEVGVARGLQWHGAGRERGWKSFDGTVADPVDDKIWDAKTGDDKIRDGKTGDVKMWAPWGSEQESGQHPPLLERFECRNGSQIGSLSSEGSLFRMQESSISNDSLS